MADGAPRLPATVANRWHAVGAVKADGGDDRRARGEEKMVEVQNSKPRCSRAKKFTKI